MFAIIIPLEGHDLPGFGGGWGSGNRPDNSLPGHRPVDPGYGRPGLPYPDLDPGHPANRPPGSGGGHPWLPGFGGGNRPDNTLPPGVDPKTSMYAGAPESSIPSHPPQPNPDLGEWVLVAMGDGQMGWAWLDKSQAQPK